MYSQLYTPDPRLPGMAHGFYHSRLNSQHVIGHGGDTAFFHSNLALLPEQGLGVYVSYVTNGGMARIDLMQAFADRYFPQSSEPLPEPAADFAERGKRFAGNYRFTRHNRSTIEKLTALGSTLVVSLSDKNRLVVTGFIPPTSHWVEIGDRLFQQLDSNELMAFEEDSAGNITHLSLGMLPFMPAYRLSWYQSTGFNLSLVALGLLFSLTVPLSALIRRKENRGSPGRARWSIRLGIVTGLLTLLFFFGFGAGIAATGNDLMYGIPTSLKAVLLLPMLLVLLTIPVALLAAGLWVGSHWSFGRRLHYSLFAISLVGLCWFYNYWNILGFRY